MTKSIALTAGGTGGHLFPAFSLAQELGRRGYEIDLITDMRGHHYGSDFPARQIHQVPAATITGKNPIAVAKTAAQLGRGTLMARKILKNLQPACIVGFGGYPTFPPILRPSRWASRLFCMNKTPSWGAPIVCWRASARRLPCPLSRLFMSTGELAQKARHTGNPVRDVVIKAAKIPYPEITPDGAFNLLVFGGSQGARYFSDEVPPAIKLLSLELRNRLYIVQQCREEDVARVDAAYKEAGINFEISTFFTNLPEIIAHSHLGAGAFGRVDRHRAFGDWPALHSGAVATCS